MLGWFGTWLITLYQSIFLNHYGEKEWIKIAPLSLSQCVLGRLGCSNEQNRFMFLKHHYLHLHFKLHTSPLNMYNKLIL